MGRWQSMRRPWASTRLTCHTAAWRKPFRLSTRRSVSGRWLCMSCTGASASAPSRLMRCWPGRARVVGRSLACCEARAASPRLWASLRLLWRLGRLGQRQRWLLRRLERRRARSVCATYRRSSRLGTGGVRAWVRRSGTGRGGRRAWPRAWSQSCAEGRATRTPTRCGWRTRRVLGARCWRVSRVAVLAMRRRAVRAGRWARRTFARSTTPTLVVLISIGSPRRRRCGWIAFGRRGASLPSRSRATRG